MIVNDAVGAALISILVGACRAPAGHAESAVGGGPLLTAVDTVVLVESDTLHLARPITLYRDAGGGFYVSDLFQNRAVYYNGRGLPERIYGTSGGGPGEIRQAINVFLRDDSTVVIFDVSQGLLNMYGRADGVFRSAVRMEGGSYHAVRSLGSTWLGVMNLGRSTAIGRWRDGDSVVEYLIPLPREYLESNPLAGIFGLASVAVWADTLVVGMAGSDTVRIFTMTGKYVSAFVVPSRRRRGIPEDLLERLDVRSGLSNEERFSAASALIDVYWKTDGSLVLVHADQQIHGRLITADVFVSLISPDRRRACVDAPLAVSKDAQPVYAFYADTLYVLEQRVVSDTDVRTTITGYTVDGTGCDWIDLE